MDKREQLIAEFIKQRCWRCEESVYDSEEDAAVDVDNLFEFMDVSIDEVLADGAECYCERDFCSYCDHMLNKND
jgi:hypothetical protein